MHGPGDIQGDPYRLDREQREFVIRAYEVDERGKRKVRRAALSRPKGRAKSELAAALSIAEALGPVRFAGFDSDGWAVGRPVKRPEIVCVATEEGQTANVYQPIYFMLTEGPLADTPQLDVGLTRTVLPDGGRILAGTGAASSKDGGRETFVVFDETHLMRGRELKEMVKVLRRNLAKRKRAEPWSLETTTAFRQGHDSIAEDSWRYAQAVREGRLADPGLLYDHREGFTDFEWEDDDALLVALAEAYGEAATWMDLDRVLGEIRDPDTDEADARRYFLNTPAEYEDTWLTLQQWEPLAADRTVPDGEPVVLGFDGSLRDDATALIGATLDGHLFTVAVWEAPPGVRNWEVDRHDVDLTVRATLERYDVRRMYCDPPHYQDYIASWQEAHPNVVVEWWTNRRTAMAAAVERLETAVRAGEVTHDGNKTLARHVGNCKVTELSEDRKLLRKDRPKSPDKIDAAVTAVLAWEARADELTSNRKRGPGKVWSY